ncbi:UNVERIFIED_ORG: hypothetical protein E4P37_07715 [Bacillus sp. AZ43]
MTTLDASPGPAPVVAAPPFSRALRIVAGFSLVLAAVLNGLSQVVGTLLAGDLSFSEQIAWGADHPVAHGVEQTALVVSSCVMLPGLLGVAHVCRFRAPVLTAIAAPLLVWGMWGFGNVLAMGYAAGTVAPSVLGVDQAVRLNDGLSGHAGSIATALVPHLIGSFLGVLLLSVAAWRSGAFPRAAAALLGAFVVWDFALPPLGPVDAHVLLLAAWTWMGAHLLRMPDAVWRGAPATTD